MTARNSRRTALSCVLVTIALSACQQRGARTDAEAPVAAAQAGSPELPIEAPRAPRPATDSPGKPQPPIDFEYSIVGEPRLGQPVEIEIRSRASAALTALNVALSGDERLLVPAEIARLRLEAAQVGAAMTRTIRVTPLTGGTHYLSVLLEAEIDGRVQARAITIPIRLSDGGAPSVAEGRLTTDAEGEPIISLPARAD